MPGAGALVAGAPAGVLPALPVAGGVWGAPPDPEPLPPTLTSGLTQLKGVLETCSTIENGELTQSWGCPEW